MQGEAANQRTAERGSRAPAPGHRSAPRPFSFTNDKGRWGGGATRFQEGVNAEMDCHSDRYRHHSRSRSRSRGGLTCWELHALWAERSRGAQALLPLEKQPPSSAWAQRRAAPSPTYRGLSAARRRLGDTTRRAGAARREGDLGIQRIA